MPSASNILRRFKACHKLVHHALLGLLAQFCFCICIEHCALLGAKLVTLNSDVLDASA